MAQSRRIQMKIYKYAIIFKSLGIIDEEDFNKITSGLPIKRHEFHRD